MEYSREPGEQDERGNGKRETAANNANHTNKKSD